MFEVVQIGALRVERLKAEGARAVVAAAAAEGIESALLGGV